MDGPGPLVAGSWLAEHAGDPGVRVIDLRWYLDGRSGRDAYAAGHIPGAVFVDLDVEITGRGGPGRHPLPGRKSFEGAMRRAGVDNASLVVVYDDAGGFSAARLWWLLRWYGHLRAAVLDGGLKLWPGPLQAGAVLVTEGDFKATEPDRSAVVDVKALHQLGHGQVLIDARAAERFSGDLEPIDPRAGHIPGARSAPWQGNLDSAGCFRTPEQLRLRFHELGADRGEQVVSYCGSGVSACHNLLALEVAGLGPGRLYEGSWSEWSSRPELPVATGPA